MRSSTDEAGSKREQGTILRSFYIRGCSRVVGSGEIAGAPDGGSFRPSWAGGFDSDVFPGLRYAPSGAILVLSLREVSAENWLVSALSPSGAVFVLSRREEFNALISSSSSERNSTL
jgi:hypothetical protein